MPGPGGGGCLVPGGVCCGGGMPGPGGGAGGAWSQGGVCSRVWGVPGLWGGLLLGVVPGPSGGVSVLGGLLPGGVPGGDSPRQLLLWVVGILLECILVITRQMLTKVSNE